MAEYGRFAVGKNAQWQRWQQWGVRTMTIPDVRRVAQDVADKYHHENENYGDGQ